ncbi:MAG TPA: UvrD-helicase domain-containing protein [Pirellulaceae bacterium]|nr:UvrD-helicase domain-containing protein [Pirellulaceae bacterium]
MSAKLNPEQQRAVDTLRGPLLVLAGAGTGKTRVVTVRIANLIRHGTPADRILAVTFTNKAAKEMQERLSHLLGKASKPKPSISTFHSHCVRVLRRNIRQLGYPEKFVIYDTGDQESLARQVLRDIHVPNDTMRPGDLLFQISSWKNSCVRPPDAARLAESDKEHLAAMAYRRYQKALKTAGAVDFDDLLLVTEELFDAFPAVRRAEAGMFDHLLVDEYQDTNGSQYRIVKALAQDHHNICVVGDDDQSIYGWRGAEVEHILRFARDWPETTTVRLEANYRSTAAILSAANTLIAYNSKRHDKVLRPARGGGEKPRILQFKDETEEAKFVVEDIRRMLTVPGTEARDLAILFRTNEQPRAFETELRKHKVPYVMLGTQSFFDRKEVKDLLAYVRVLAYPHDEASLRRIINTPARGITSKTIENLLKVAVVEGKTLWDIMDRPQLPPEVKDTAAEAVQKFVAFVKQFRHRMDREPMGDVMRELIVRISYQSELQRIYPEAAEQQVRLGAVEEVVNALSIYYQENADKKASLSGFLDEVTLGDRDFGNNEKDKQLARNAIALLTLHSAKGLEYPYVYMVGMEEGLLPHHRSVKAEGEAIDEERRLCYVGVTRAQERLTLTMALTRMKWGKPRDSTPSRFLYEIIGQADNPNDRGTAPRKPATRKA